MLIVLRGAEDMGDGCQIPGATPGDQSCYTNYVLGDGQSFNQAYCTYHFLLLLNQSLIPVHS